MDTQDHNPRVTLGDNQPPEPTAASASPLDVMRQRSSPLLVGALVTAIFGRPGQIKDAADLEAAAKFVKDSREQFRNVNTLRDDLKRPYDEMGKSIQAWFVPVLNALEAGSKHANREIGAYNERIAEKARQEAAEAARLQREEGERRLKVADNLLDSGLDAAADGVAEMGLESIGQAVQLEAQARGSTADLARVSTSVGTVSSKVEWTQAVTDQKALRATLGALGPYFTLPELEKAARAYRVQAVKMGEEPTLPGVVFTKGSVGIVR